MMDRMPERVDSKFRFVLLSAQRAEQMMRGARPRMEEKRSKVARCAMEEIIHNLVDWDYGPAPVPEQEGESLESTDEEAEPGEEVN